MVPHDAVMAVTVADSRDTGDWHAGMKPDTHEETGRGDSMAAALRSLADALDADEAGPDVALDLRHGARRGIQLAKRRDTGDWHAGFRAPSRRETGRDDTKAGALRDLADALDAAGGGA